jgi:hypothetical protein
MMVDAYCSKNSGWSEAEIMDTNSATVTVRHEWGV